MTCGCAKRRKSLRAKRDAKRAQGKTTQAAAIDVVLKATEIVGTAIGIDGEEQDDERGQGSGSTGSSSSSD